MCGSDGSMTSLVSKEPCLSHWENSSSGSMSWTPNRRSLSTATTGYGVFTPPCSSDRWALARHRTWPGGSMAGPCVSIPRFLAIKACKFKVHRIDSIILSDNISKNDIPFGRRRSLWRPILHAPIWMVGWAGADFYRRRSGAQKFIPIFRLTPPPMSPWTV